ncbi:MULTISPECIES: hypothetical protein [Bradyrhizobium]|nr:MULTISPECIES: hypothetical protein [Bradyrhizobium]
MKTLLDDTIENDTELAFYAQVARIAVTGEPDQTGRSSNAG